MPDLQSFFYIVDSPPGKEMCVGPNSSLRRGSRQSCWAHLPDNGWQDTWEWLTLHHGRVLINALISTFYLLVSSAWSLSLIKWSFHVFSKETILFFPISIPFWGRKKKLKKVTHLLSGKLGLKQWSTLGKQEVCSISLLLTWLIFFSVFWHVFFQTNHRKNSWQLGLIFFFFSPTFRHQM